jgi:predicted metal-dependent peptidase
MSMGRGLAQLRAEKAAREAEESVADSPAVKLANARNQARESYGMFYPVFSKLSVVFDPSVGTMGVSWDGIVGVAPKFVENQSLSKLKWTWLHEALHVHNRHAARWVRMLGLDPTDMVAAYAIISKTPWMQATARMWNIAADAAINQLLENMARALGEELPEGYISPATIGAPYGLTVEGYYKFLLEKEQEKEDEEQPDEPGDEGQPGDEGDDGEADSGENSSSDDQPSQESEGESSEGDEGQPGKGGDSSDGDGGESSEGEGGTPGPSTEPGKGSSGSSAGGLPQNWEAKHRAEGAGVPENIMQRAAEKVLEKAKEMLEAGEGNVPGYMKQAIEDAEPEPVSWDMELTNHFSDAKFDPTLYGYGDDTSYGKISHAQFRYGGFGPGIPIQPCEIARKPHVAVVADTSWSMRECIHYVLKTIKGIGEQGDVEFSFVCCDYAAGEVTELENIDEVANLITGGGGTSFIPAFEALEKTGRSYSSIVYVTDGVGQAPDEMPAFIEDVVWCLVGGHKRIPRNSQRQSIDWGTIINVDEQ